jgi:hypothetical protein
VRLDTAALRAREARVAEKRGDGTRRGTFLRETALGHYEAVAAALEGRCRGVVDWETRAQALLGCEHVGRRLGRPTEGWVREALACVEKAKAAVAARRVESSQDADLDAEVEGWNLEATAEAVARAMAKI